MTEKEFLDAFLLHMLNSKTVGMFATSLSSDIESEIDTFLKQHFSKYKKMRFKTIPASANMYRKRRSLDNEDTANND